MLPAERQTSEGSEQDLESISSSNLSQWLIRSKLSKNAILEFNKSKFENMDEVIAITHELGVQSVLNSSNLQNSPCDEIRLELALEKLLSKPPKSYKHSSLSNTNKKVNLSNEENNAMSVLENDIQSIDILLIKHQQQMNSFLTNYKSELKILDEEFKILADKLNERKLYLVISMNKAFETESIKMDETLDILKQIKCEYEITKAEYNLLSSEIPTDERKKLNLSKIGNVIKNIQNTKNITFAKNIIFKFEETSKQKIYHALEIYTKRGEGIGEICLISTPDIIDIPYISVNKIRVQFRGVYNISKYEVQIIDGNDVDQKCEGSENELLFNEPEKKSKQIILDVNMNNYNIYDQNIRNLIADHSYVMEIRGFCTQSKIWSKFSSKMRFKTLPKSKGIFNIFQAKQKKKKRVMSAVCNNILLLGIGNSGKSTIFKHIQILYSNAMVQYKNQIFSQLIRDMTAVIMQCRCCENKNSAFKLKDSLLVFCDIISNSYSDINEYSITEIKSIYQALDVLWKDVIIKQIFADRGYYSNMQIADSTEYFLNDLKRIQEENFQATNKDILAVRQNTYEYDHFCFSYKSCEWNICDTGGQVSDLSERAKWIQYCNECSVVFYVVNLHSYDEYNGNSHKNEMHKSLNEFKTRVVNNKLLMAGLKDNKRRLTLLLILNKYDLFEKKIKHVSLRLCWPEFKGVEKNAKIGLQFIQAKFNQALYTNSASHNCFPIKMNVQVIDARCKMDIQKILQIVAKKV